MVAARSLGCPVLAELDVWVLVRAVGVGDRGQHERGLSPVEVGHVPGQVDGGAARQRRGEAHQALLSAQARQSPFRAPDPLGVGAGPVGHRVADDLGPICAT